LMSNAASLATLDVLTKLGPPAHYTDANVRSMVICRAVNLSLEGGNCDGSCYAYTVLGRIAGPEFGDYEAGIRFGRLGYELVEQRGLKRFQARTYLNFGYLLMFWTRHVREGRDLLRRAFETANQIGDLTFAAYYYTHLNTYLLAAGDPLDTVHFHWDRCRVQDTTTTGVVRVELREATRSASGYDYLLTITVADLRIERDGQPSATVNFIAQVHYTHTGTFDRVEVSNAVFDSGQVIGDTGTATVNVDYRLDGAAQTYQYEVHGTVSSGGLGGEVQFSTPAPFTGVIGEYPAAGRLQVLGNANSGARLAEEGAAAGDPATVLVELDTNGDGVADASEPRLAWAGVVSAQLFAAYPDQVTVIVPMP